MSRLLLVSNGHGEDIIGAALGLVLAGLGHEPLALPLVGKGDAYENAGFAVLGPRRVMPSGGFVLDRKTAFLDDLRAGWLAMSIKQWRVARRTTIHTVGTVAIGDIYALAVAVGLARRPVFQVQPLVSIRAWGGGGWDTRKSFVLPERLLMRQTRRVYPRDAEGALWLREHGVAQAEYLGNPMLDALGGVPLELSPPYLLLLPGSRTDAFESLPKMLEVCRLLRDTGLTPVVAWAGLPVDERVAGSGWQVEATGRVEGVTHRLEYPDEVAIHLTQGAFRSCILGAEVAISTSGTAAEQAAGYGVPVVGFPTAGPQYMPAFALSQKRLLGDALSLAEPEPKAIARAVRQLLASGELRKRALTAGRSAMGEPGAIERIALDIDRSLG